MAVAGDMECYISCFKLMVIETAAIDPAGSY